MTTNTQRKVIETITHLRPNKDVNNKGGLTVVATHVDGDSFITIRTSVCSQRDTYIKKIGVELAKKSGNGIRLPFTPISSRHSMTHDMLRDFVDQVFGEYGID